MSSEKAKKYLCEMITKKDIKSALKEMIENDFLFSVFPELKELDGLKQPSNYHDYDVLGHTFESVGYCDIDLALRLTMLLHDVGKSKTQKIDSESEKITFYGHSLESAKMARVMLNRLGFEKDIIEEICLYIYHHMDYAPTEKSFQKMAKTFNYDYDKINKFLKVKLYDSYASKGKDSEIARNALNENKEYKKFLNIYVR